jgi:hypothetical protein
VPWLALPLLVFSVLANNANNAFALDDFTFIANFFNRRSDFHESPITPFPRFFSLFKLLKLLNNLKAQFKKQEIAVGQASITKT